MLRFVIQTFSGNTVASLQIGDYMDQGNRVAVTTEGSKYPQVFEKLLNFLCYADNFQFTIKFKEDTKRG